MRVILRRITAADAYRAAEFLDSRTLSLRWLVAFFQHFRDLPAEEEPYWSLWRGDGVDPEGIQCVVAHFFQNGTTYICAEPTTDLPTLEDLLDEELLPEKVVGDSATLERWRTERPSFAIRVSEWKDIVVLENRSCEEPPGGAPLFLRAPLFRRATTADLPVLEQYGRLLETELGEEFARDFESLVDHGLLFVAEDGGRVKGYVRSNFSDGRFVHAGGLYVHPLYRGKGVGRVLAQGLAAQVRRELGARLLLDAYGDNAAALKAYERAGFVRVGSGLEARIEDGAWQG